MEKFTNWRDKGTGISPFLPNLPTGVGAGALISVVKFVAALPLLVLLGAGTLVLGSTLFPLWNSVLSMLVSTSVELSIANMKRKDVTNDKKPRAGECYFVNFTSPLDYFLLARVAQDPFIILMPNSKGQLCQVPSAWAFMQCALNGGFYEGTPFKGDKEKHVLFVFAEGVTSNNKSIVSFSINKLPDYISEARTLGIKTPPVLCTPLPLGSSTFLWRLLATGQVAWKCKIGEPLNSVSLTSIRNDLSMQNKLPTVSLDWAAKESFIKAFGAGKR